MAYYGRDYRESPYRRGWSFGEDTYDNDFRSGRDRTAQDRGRWNWGEGPDRGDAREGFGRTWGRQRETPGYGTPVHGWDSDRGMGPNTFDRSVGRSQFSDRYGPFGRGGFNRDQGYYGSDYRGSGRGSDYRGSDYRGRYDDDFGDRIKRGWNRLREEARDWVGRGYDRNW